jgi:AcrR family transcriptional regulator
MARPRVIDQNEILDAAEAVVTRDGAARLTLDAVAIEAGISKASVIYDYKGKQALIKAIIERRVDQDRQKLELAIRRLGSVPNAHIKGRIVKLAETKPDGTESVALQLCSALAQDEDLRSAMQLLVKQQLDEIVGESPNPDPVLLAFLALEGLRFLELLGLLSWPQEKRTEILQDIERLADLPSGELGSRPSTLLPSPIGAA